MYWMIGFASKFFRASPGFLVVQSLRLDEMSLGKDHLEDATSTEADGDPVKVKEKHSCGREHHDLGRYRSVQDCAKAVRAFGGKFFTYSRNVLRLRKRCFVQFALSEACPEGWQKTFWYDFYKVESSSPDPVDAITAGGAQLVKVGSWCNSSYTYIGKFDTLKQCAHTVAVAGGKFFNYDRRWPGTGNCYHILTQSAACPEGFKEGKYDFYDLPDVAAKDAVGSIVRDVEVRAWSESGAFASRLLNKDDLFESAYWVVGLRTGLIRKNVITRKNTHCDQQFRVATHKGEVVVETWEVCCTVKRAWRDANQQMCHPEGDRTLRSRVPLGKRGAKFEQCGNPTGKDADVKFQGIAPGRSYLDQGNSSGKVCFDVTAKTVTRMLWEKVTDCSSVRKNFMRFGNSVSRNVGNFLRLLVPKRSKKNRSTLRRGTFDFYSRLMYDLVEVEGRQYGGGKANELIHTPTKTKLLDRLSAYTFTGVPTEEIDQSKDTFKGKMACTVDILRTIPRDEVALFNGVNTWDESLSSGCPDQKKTCTKKEFMVGLFYNFTNKDGESVYPKEQVNLREKYLVQGKWEDEAEAFLASDRWISHRVEKSDRPDFSSVVRSNDFGAIVVNDGFGRLGADMYFDMTGLPALVVTPDGEEIARADPAWQHWKFVWRSSMLVKVMFVDDIWGSRYGVANSLAATSRETLPGTHPLRRLLTLFTCGTIEENSRMFPQLMAPDTLLDRAVPFANFQQVNNITIEAIPSLETQFGFLLSEDEPPTGQTPYVEDGRSLFVLIRKLFFRWFDLHDDWCQNGVLVDKDIKFFLDRYQTWSVSAQRFRESDEAFLEMRNEEGNYKCDGVVRWLSVQSFRVTGFRNHIQQMADEIIDPDFVGFSWATGESSARPRQALAAALLTASATAKRWPKLTDDFSFIALELPKAERAALLLNVFQGDMLALKDTIDERNKARPVPYNGMHPEFMSINGA